MDTYQYQLLPALAPDEYDALKADIAKRGVQVAVEYDEDENILDGHHRVKACRELGIKDWPRTVRVGMNEAAKMEHVLALNLDRRHLTREQRRELVAKLRAQGWSTRRIADRLKVGVATVSRDARSGVPFGTPERVTGADGKQYPAQRAELAAMPVSLFEPDDEGSDEPEPELKNPALYSSNSVEWYTPQEILERVVGTMGSIDLDPCSNSKDAPNVPADMHYTQDDDGLAQIWRGRVYMNPPYGRELGDWIHKLVVEFKCQHTTEAIALVPSRTDTRWFRELCQYPRCFIWGRLKFSGCTNSATFPSMAVYLGENRERFVEVFSEIGDTYELVQEP